jgi:thiol-disulfide isomerase/thioredoxin
MGKVRFYFIFGFFFILLFSLSLISVTLININVKDERLLALLYFLIFFVQSLFLYFKIKVLNNFHKLIVLVTPLFFLCIYILLFSPALFPLYMPANPLAGIFGVIGGYLIYKKSKAVWLYFLLIATGIFVYSYIFLPQAIAKVQIISLKKLETKSVLLQNIVDLNGNDVSLASLGNPRVLLLDFWFIGCEPCMVKMKYLEELRKHYLLNPNVKIAVVSFGSSDTIEEVLIYKQKHPEFTFTFLYDKAGRFCDTNGFNGFPIEIILDEHLTIRSTYHGFRKASANLYVKETKNKIDSLLGQSDFKLKAD